MYKEQGRGSELREIAALLSALLLGILYELVSRIYMSKSSAQAFGDYSIVNASGVKVLRWQ